MNKILISFLLALFVCESYANSFLTFNNNIVTVKTCNDAVCGSVSMDEIKSFHPGAKYIIEDVHITMDNFSEWQNWNANVELHKLVNLYAKNFDGIAHNTAVNHAENDSFLNLTIIDTSNLYKIEQSSGDYSPTISINLVRETNYEKIFNGSRGKYLENIRSKNPNDKMLLAMDNAKSMNEINSIMNSSYRFNPIILMHPIKTINRADLFNVNTDNFNTGANVRVGYLTSDKIDDMNARFNIGNVYKDLYFNIGVNIDTFVFDVFYSIFN